MSSPKPGHWGNFNISGQQLVAARTPCGVYLVLPVAVDFFS